MMLLVRLARVWGPGGRRWAAAVVAVLAVCGVSSSLPAAAAEGSSSVPNWTNQAPPAHPSGRGGMAMAYDAATGTVVLFGGDANGTIVNGTWTWNGTTWTQQHPATSPPARWLASMAYDAATGTVVLFGGENRGALGDTWTWDGTTWTKQHPATRPPARDDASMAYDAATGTVVLFSGNGVPGDTWTWDGTTWTKQHPATSPPPRDNATMAYDAATGTTVLFGGINAGASVVLGDTWTWDGTTWTQQHPATSPPAREGASMAYDAATGTAVLFGGSPGTGLTVLGDTWTWDGTTWTQQAPATSPAARWLPSMAYDAATRTAVLFGGIRPRQRGDHSFRDTWTWG